MIGFGLDPAGYRKSWSVLAAVERRGSNAGVTSLRNCPLSCAPNEEHEIAGILVGEQKALKAIVVLGYIPIDLQGLPTVCAPTHLCQQTKRNVDRKVGGLEPLASFIGHVTARFQSIFCDAVICALTAAASADELRSTADYENEAPDIALEELPRGYRLLSRGPFERLTISTGDYDHWKREMSSKIQ